MMLELPARVLASALSYRAFLVALSLASHAILQDYDTSTLLLFPDTGQGGVCGIVREAAVAFDKWDSIHMLRIADEGYVHEIQHAFYPLLPLASRMLRPFFSLVMPGCDERSILVLSACTLSHISAILSLWPMYFLSLKHLPSKGAAELATLLFALQPSSPFTMAPYTEALFSLLSLSSELQVEQGHIVRASLLMALASGLRSNGVLLPVFFIAPLFLPLLRPRTAHNRLSRASVLVAALAISALPHIIFTLYGAGLYCFPAELQRAVAVFNVFGNGQGWSGLQRAAEKRAPRPWCRSGWASPLSNIYSFVQSHYWGVGLLRYYRLEQVPNFLLAAPAVVISLTGCADFFKARSNGDCTRFMGCGALPYVLHAGFLTVFAVLNINVQVATRLLSSCPAIYWFAARLLVKDDGKISSGAAQGSALSLGAKCIVAYYLGFGCVGSVLFSTFLPWT